MQIFKSRIYQINVRPKKSSLVSGNWPGENIFITATSTLSNVYQNKNFCFQKTNNQVKKNKNTKKAKKIKEEKRICPENR